MALEEVRTLRKRVLGRYRGKVLRPLWSGGKCGSEGAGTARGIRGPALAACGYIGLPTPAVTKPEEALPQLFSWLGHG